MDPMNMAIMSTFGKQTSAVQQMFGNFYETAKQTIGNTAFFQEAVQTYEDINFGETARTIDKMRSEFSTVLDVDNIRVIRTVPEMQQADSKMRRVIMAAPAVRESFNNGYIAGYGELYGNASPQGVGVHHFDYRWLTNGLGIVTVDEETQTKEVVFRTFFERIQEEKLSIFEKHDAWITMEHAQALLEEQEYDFTSPDNALL